MSGIITCVVTSVTWCFCTATASLLGSCCGNDKPSTIPPGASSGRKRSVLLLVLAIIFAFAYQYGVGPRIQDAVESVPGSDYIPGGNYITEAWTDGCLDLETDELQDRCVGNNGAYRVMASATLFYTLLAIAAYCKPTANREAWPAKYVLFTFLVAITAFIPSEPLFNPIYLNIGRILSIFFIIFNQIIIIDLAYNWNDGWVTNADKADDELSGAGKKWLAAILVSAAIMFITSLVGIGLMFHYFTGCSTNNAFITITLICLFLITILQLRSEEGSLLTSAALCLYATFLCYTAVSKNPNAVCNPNLGELDKWGIALGIIVSLLSVAWTGWSSTADSRIQGIGGTSEHDSSNDNTTQSSQNKKVTGVVTGQDYGTHNDEEEAAHQDEQQQEEETGVDGKQYFGNSYKLNLLLVFVSCFVAMSLTGWGSIESGGDAANPGVGRVSMWMIITSQWLMLTLYMWTLIAPKLFPNRDFS